MYSNVFPIFESDFCAFPDGACGCKVYEGDKKGKRGSKKKPTRPQRTSTPVADHEESSSGSYTDSVTEFFYQSWKSELISTPFDDTRSSCSRPLAKNQVQNVNYYPADQFFQPVWYSSSVLFFNCFTSYICMPCCNSIVYYPAVGYRQDGTYGVLPDFWYYSYKQ